MWRLGPDPPPQINVKHPLIPTLSQPDVVNEEFALGPLMVPVQPSPVKLREEVTLTVCPVETQVNPDGPVKVSLRSSKVKVVVVA
jgi:hypothetical protein